MYRAFSVWDRSEEGLYRYRMFENLRTGKYCVLMRDYFGKNSSIPKDLLFNLEKYFVELLIEMAPEDRNGAYETTWQAIEGFDKYSSNEEGESGGDKS
jgi:hypothetical protein